MEPGDQVGVQEIISHRDGSQETNCWLCRSTLLFYAGDVITFGYVRASGSYYVTCTMCQQQLNGGSSSTDVSEVASE